VARRVLALAVCAVVALAAFSVHAAERCDRPCLAQFADRYLLALVAHDAARLPLGRDVRYTENGQLLDLHDGLWGTVTVLGKYRNTFEDPTAGEVIVFAVLHEHAYLDLVATRLRIDRGRISEIETIVSRPGGAFGSRGPKALEALGKPDPLWTTDVPRAERMTRAELAKVANEYFTGMENDDGHGIYPFAGDCYRLENGIRTTGNASLKIGSASGSAGVNYASLGCKAQFQLGFLHVVSRIRDRRFLVVDPQRGVAVAFAFFDHNAQLRSFKLANGRTVSSGLNAPITWEVCEAFKVEHGLIRRIEAVFTQSPYGMRPNWSESGLGYDPRRGPR
jgi:hypothetical protein